MNKKQYFASSNSMMGFHSYFNDIYDPTKLKRIYIIKGGPGTGKSSTMKRVGEMFENSFGCEYFLCSSDPNSLDGIIIGGQVAIIDGTAPHITEAKYPGAVEILIDNAHGINRDIISRKKDIIELNKEKAKYYRYAYTYLKAAGEIKKEHVRKLYSKINLNKLDAAIDRYFKQNLKAGNAYNETIRLTEAITPEGIYRTEGFEDISKNKTIIVNGRGYEEIVYNAILRKAQEYKLNTTVSYDPLVAFSPNGICFKENSNCIVKYCEKKHGEINYDEYKVINFDRFTDKSNFGELKSKLKFAEKCMENLMNESILNLYMASNVHKKLEEIYLQYTDFSKIDENIQYIISDISDFFASNNIVHNKR